MGAVSAATMPPNGELQLGPVRLPEGRQIYGPGHQEGLAPVLAWVTLEPVPDPGRVWSRLSGLSGQTGLVPFLAAPLRGHRRRPWPREGFTADLSWPADLAEVDRLDGAAVLAGRWARRRYGLGDEDPPDLVGLAAAARPADLLAVLGWYPANWIGGLTPLTAALRSWEDRFGARMFEVGLPVVRMLVARPPQDRTAALAIAAEQWALADECWPGAETGLDDVRDIADHLLGTPTWGFYWS
jgi:hypothetical protein